MSNPYGWCPPSNGQPPVYFAPPAQSFQSTSPGPDDVVPGPGYYRAPETPYIAAPETSYSAAPGAPYSPTTAAAPYYAVPEASTYAAPDAPYDNGYKAYRSFRDQHAPRPPLHDAFAGLPRDSNPFLSLSARGARPKVTMVEAMILWLRNWDNFSGRASRSEYWWIRVVQFAGQALWWLLLFGAIQMRGLAPTDDVVNLVVNIALLVTSLVALVLWIPTLSLTVRRLHDTDHSGWYVFMRYVPFGSWMLFAALRQDGVASGFRFDDSTRRPYGVEDID